MAEHMRPKPKKSGGGTPRGFPLVGTSWRVNLHDFLLIFHALRAITEASVFEN